MTESGVEKGVKRTLRVWFPLRRMKSLLTGTERGSGREVRVAGRAQLLHVEAGERWAI